MLPLHLPTTARSSRLPVALALCLFLLAGCTPLAKVKRHEAILPAPATPSALFSTTRPLLTEARHSAAKAPKHALGCYLESASQSAAALRRSPADKTALETYNFAVARIIETLQNANLEPWKQPITVTGTETTYTLGFKSFHTENNPSDYLLIPADTLEVGGKFFQSRQRSDGIGAALVAIGKKDAPNYREVYSQKRLYGSVTALIRFKGSRANLEFHQPLVRDIITFQGRTVPLAADFTAPLTLLMAETHPEKLGLVRLIWPENYQQTAILTRFQAYDPNRIPLVFVHGLDSTPATWMPTINGLRKDPEVRRHYQVWVFSYPSGYPYPYAASLLRKELNGIDAAFPGHKPIVLIGHSMGGLINRLMITDVNDRLWLDYFGTPPDATPFEGLSADLLKQTLIFNTRDDVSRSIFICAPHRGCDIASDWVGRLVSRLIRTPTFLADIRDSVLSVVTIDRSALHLKAMPNSIDTLAPNNRFIQKINRFPINPRVPCHSIIGDRGRGDSPNSSDGVVPYWSSHLDGAQSERIVPHNHNSHRSPEAIAEVILILRLHASLPPIEEKNSTVTELKPKSSLP